MKFSCLNILAAKSRKLFHFTSVMSLHYLVKLKMLIAPVLPWSC